ncbi:hypothetical protein GCM10011430_19340 [Oxalicibacterium solurbis]|uniref:Uncharacterized protein n=1 Tax=Oxalicibacterium solurbis TaxID=69280 RepID=A0A8J3AWR7_9BURK|nr:hypothetical protein GCM10011430_19340 [Oxalicibacterium solurbis]
MDEKREEKTIGASFFASVMMAMHLVAGLMFDLMAGLMIGMAGMRIIRRVFSG